MNDVVAVDYDVVVDVVDVVVDDDDADFDLTDAVAAVRVFARDFVRVFVDVDGIVVAAAVVFDAVVLAVL
ncbi:hypothetical protein HPULCUR_010205 [Helicostylum pulchrum]|uniref:Uncharacterized protein n=1 Tax=Helicostylum pulchrum TaxID=562976 RepID=A0ABP9YCL8_9FUNG